MKTIFMMAIVIIIMAGAVSFIFSHTIGSPDQFSDFFQSALLGVILITLLENKKEK